MASKKYFHVLGKKELFSRRQNLAWLFYEWGPSLNSWTNSWEDRQQYEIYHNYTVCICFDNWEAEGSNIFSTYRLIELMSISYLMSRSEKWMSWWNTLHSSLFFNLKVYLLCKIFFYFLLDIHTCLFSITF